jgi:tRNA pseudouridine55 synthase
MVTISGFLNIDKPAGLTSHDVVAAVRQATRLKKVGHGGTLDPLATGVLILCLGHATRLSDFAMQHPKIYQAEIRLGLETDTYDTEGRTVATVNTPVTREQIEAVLPQLRGNIAQIPPMYSAIKHGGKKLYQLARHGQTVERSARCVTIEALEITHWEYPYLGLQIVCSPGTYVRSLAHDIGQIVGCGACLSALRRLASGSNFRLANAVAWDTLQAAMACNDWQRFLLPPDIVLDMLPRVDLTEGECQRVQRGGFLQLSFAEKRLLRAYGERGQLVALLEPRPDHPTQWKPMKVFID